MDDYIEAFLGKDNSPSEPVIAPSPQRHTKNKSKKRWKPLRSLKNTATNLRYSGVFQVTQDHPLRRFNGKNKSNPIDLSVPGSRSRDRSLHLGATLKKNRSFSDIKDALPKTDSPLLPLHIPLKAPESAGNEVETNLDEHYSTRGTAQKETKDDTSTSSKKCSDHSFSEELWRLSEQDCAAILKNYEVVKKTSQIAKALSKEESDVVCSVASGGTSNMSKGASPENVDKLAIPLTSTDLSADSSVESFLDISRVETKEGTTRQAHHVRHRQVARRPSLTEMFQCSMHTIDSWDLDDTGGCEASTEYEEYEEEKSSKEQNTEDNGMEESSECQAPSPRYEILGTLEKCSAPSYVMSPAILGAIRPHLPFVVHQDNYWLKYSMIRDGSSLRSLFQHIQSSPRTIIAIETMNGEIFGSFTSTHWRVSGLEYYGSGESFLWKLKKPRTVSCNTVEDQVVLESEVEIFSWAGNNWNVQCLPNLDESPIIIGGGEENISFNVPNSDFGAGLIIDQDLSRGTSNPCATFQSPALCSGKDFKIKNIEAWTLTPVSSIEQAESLERALNFVKENNNSFRAHRRASI